MSDAGTKYTDKRFEVIRKRLLEIYRAAQLEIIKALNEHIQKMAAQDAINRALVEAGKMTKAQYDTWLYGQMFTEKAWKDKLNSIADTILHVNENANRIIDGERKAVFGENMTFQAYSLEKDAGMDMSFTVYDSATVTRLIKGNPKLLPPKKVDRKADLRWNLNKITDIIAKGIITGNGIPEIVENIAEVLGMQNYNAAVRQARTAMTAAQNAGRIEMLHEAQEMGIKVKKMWLATLDDRTRDAHQELDGQKQEVDDPFDSILGPIMYPGDPDADPANVWNCRCTLVYKYDEYPNKNETRYDQMNGEKIAFMTYKEWKEWKANGGE